MLLGVEKGNFDQKNKITKNRNYKTEHQLIAYRQGRQSFINPKARKNTIAKTAKKSPNSYVRENDFQKWLT